MNNNEKEITLFDLIIFLKKNIILIIASTFLVTIIGVIYTYGLTKEKYQSSAMAIIQVVDSTGKFDSTNTLRIVPSVSEFMKSSLVMKAVVENREELSHLSYKALQAGTKVSYVQNSLNVVVSYVGNNPDLCPLIVDAIIDVSKEIADNTVTEDGKLYFPSIANSISRATIASDPVNVSTSKKMLLLIFFFVGAILGTIGAILKELFKIGLKEFKQAEEVHN